MEAANIVERTTDGDITTVGSYLRAVTLTAGSDAATVVVKAGGSSGTTVLTLKAAANTSISAGGIGDAYCAGGIYVDLTGTSPAVSVTYM